MIEFRKLCARKGFSLPQLCAFLEVAEAGGIAKVVSKTSTQSLYCRQIRQLEKFFGLQLFYNRGKTKVLTDAGLELVRVANKALIGLFDFTQTCEKRPTRFIVAGGASLLNCLLAPKVGNLFQLVDSISLRLRTSSNRAVIAGLHDFTVHFGLVKEPSIPNGLAGEDLGEVDYVLYIPKRLIPRGMEPTWNWAVENVPIACQGSEGGALQRALEENHRNGKSRLRFAFESDTYVAVLRVLTSGSFAAILPSIMTAESEMNEFVALKAPALSFFDRPVFLLWNPRMIELRGMRAEAVKECLTKILTLKRTSGTRRRDRG